MSKLIITHMEYQGKPLLAAALTSENRICQLHFMESQSSGILGNIYVAKVRKIVKNIQAAFLEIADGNMCYYSMAEEETPFFTNPKKDNSLKVGDELVVQVSREAMQAKLPRVTGNLNFTGRYLVLTSRRRELGFSSKLSKAEKKRLQELLAPLLPEDAGLIVRTNCRGAEEAEILQELEALQNRYHTLLQHAKSRVCFSLLEEHIPDYIQVLQNTYTQDLEEIVTEAPTLYHQISHYMALNSQKQVSLRLYEDSLLPLAKLYGLESALKQALEEKVWLKSGGFLVIQQTEAFVSIDVNTGKCTIKKEAQETFRSINLEAAKEIAFQLRLRNLSGIILIDFINMKNQEDKEELLKVLQKALQKDPVKGTVVDITPLHIVEVTRKKVRKSLKEELLEKKGY